MNCKTMLLTGMMFVAAGLFAGNKEKMVEEMLVLSGTPDMLKQVTEEVSKMQVEMINRQASLSADRKAKLIDFQKQIMAKIADFIGWDKMKSDYIAIYSDVYSEEELNALINFLKTPVGQKMVKKNPQLMQKTLEIMQQKMLVLMPELERMGQAFAAAQEEKPAAGAAQTATTGAAKTPAVTPVATKK